MIFLIGGHTPADTNGVGMILAKGAVKMACNYDAAAIRNNELTGYSLHVPLVLTDGSGI